ncbi:MAG: beta-hydroxyacyl-ACP dehydratase [Gemmataceae bacterium]|nr:beta-hydroxyacyl-ACP dehydratase [Gemmataceae bacterium]MDW8266264.1 3-hydroxyacyl-ACP dehydratase FabZ family protein [Gemmataceae bacterium]
MPPEVHLDPQAIDLNRVVADIDAIRRVNPQRHEMEQLTAIVLIDPERHLIVGYKDVRPDEFWVRGHMPDYPLFPGVLMCEAAAQLCSFYTASQGVMAGDFIGFGGLENVRFRSPVRPGDRLVLIGKGVRLRRRQTVFNVQGFVQATMVFHADVIGVPLTRKGGP